MANVPFVRIRGVRSDLMARFKALCRTRRKRIKVVCTALFRRYATDPSKFDVPQNRWGRTLDGEQFILGRFPLADWCQFRSVVVRRGEATADAVEALMAAYCQNPGKYEPEKVRRPKGRRKPRNPLRMPSYVE